MKIAIIFALAAVATAAKLQGGTDHNPEAALIGVITDTRDGPIEANYKYVLETENGIRLTESGSPGSEGQSNKVGSFAYESPEGILVEVAYTADEGGFQPTGEFIPVDHPKPPHALEQLRIADEQRAQGIKFDERGFRV